MAERKTPAKTPAKPATKAQPKQGWKALLEQGGQATFTEDAPGSDAPDPVVAEPVKAKRAPSRAKAANAPEPEIAVSPVRGLTRPAVKQFGFRLPVGMGERFDEAAEILARREQWMSRDQMVTRAFNEWLERLREE